MIVSAQIMFIKMYSLYYSGLRLRYLFIPASAPPKNKIKYTKWENDFLLRTHVNLNTPQSGGNCKTK